VVCFIFTRYHIDISNYIGFINGCAIKMKGTVMPFLKYNLFA